MSKVMLIAEKINDETALIRKLRGLTNKPICEIKKSIMNGVPFFEALVSGNQGAENEQIILEILRFANQQGDRIKIFELGRSNSAYEITHEVFENDVRTGEEIIRDLEELES